jgi:hypothetical protein
VLRDPLLGWVVAAKSATAGRTGRACVSLAAISAFGSMSSLTQLVLGSPKNHLPLDGSKFFMVNWPCSHMVFGQGALFRKREVDFPVEGAERSRPPKGRPPIRPGAETPARQRPEGLSTKRAVRVVYGLGLAYKPIKGHQIQGQRSRCRSGVSLATKPTAGMRSFGSK